MNKDYDSILKEKNQTKSILSEISEENSNKPNYVIICMFVCIIIVVISYIVYFNTILSGKNIFLNDFKVISNEYMNIITNLNFNYDLIGSYDGNISIVNGNNNRELSYNIDSDGNNIYFNIFDDSDNVEYYSDGVNSLVKGNNISDSYINIGDISIYDYIDLYGNLINNINSFLDDKDNYNKDFYFEGEQPVVKIEVNFNDEEINNIIGNENLMLDGDYNINITFLNNAFTNDIISVKVIVNNRSEDKRSVYLYENNAISYTNDDGVDDRIEISNDGSDFVLEYYKNDVLYSVLSGTLGNNGYDYLYQVIDSRYNIKLNVNNSENSYEYLFDFNIDTDTKKYDFSMSIDGEYSSDSIVDVAIENVIEKDKLNDSQLDSYNNLVNNLLGIDFRDVFSDD